MRLFIIEDEAAASRQLKRLCEKYLPEFEIAGAVQSVREAISWLSVNPTPEVIFMDVELTDGQSFDILKEVDVSSFVIFTTAYDQFAIKAFDLNSLAYLLKPINEDHFKKAIKKLRGQLSTSTVTNNWQSLLNTLPVSTTTDYKERFLIRHGSKLISLAENQIAYFHREDSVVLVYTSDGSKFNVSNSLEELEQLLDPKIFFRINRSFLARISAISEINDYFNSKLKLKLSPPVPKDVIVSKEKSSVFKKWLDGNLF
jgi:two-component system, LytTR family, response regulator